MKQAVVDAREFETALKTAAAAVMRRSSIAMLEQVYLSVSDGACRLTGTDLTQWVEIKMPTKSCGEDFSAIFRDTSKILKACKYYKSDIKISFHTGNKQPLVFSSGELQMECEIIEDEYPAIPTEDAEQSYEVVASVLHRRAEKVKYAAATNDARPVLMGVQFRNQTVFCVDGHRMAASQMDGLNVKRPVSIPLNAMMQLSIFGDNTISFSTGVRFARFANERAVISTRLLDGAVMVPDLYVPQSFQHKFPLEPTSCIQSVKYLQDVSGKACNHAEFQNGVLLVETLHGSYRAPLPIQGNSQINFAIDPRYLLDGIRQFKEGANVELRANDEQLSPIVITDGGDSYAFILTRRRRERAAA